MTIKSQGHSLTLVQAHSDSTLPNFFSWETAKAIEAKFRAKLQWDGGTKVCSNGLGHMSEMAAIPIYGKNVKILSSQTADELKSLYAILSDRVLPHLFKWWPWVDLDLFYGKVKFGLLCFSMGKS